jgi:hypothetical protein
MEIDGIPLHPLIVHAVVVFAPLAATLALVYAVVPRWRWALRWPLVVCTLIAAGSAYGATLTGANLLESRPFLKDLPAVAKHQEAGTRLRNVLFLFVVVVALAGWQLGGPSGLSSGRGAREERGGAVGIVVSVALVLVSLAVLVTAILAGHSGSKAVWGS